LIPAVEDALSEFEVDILVVDDNSQDGTVSVATRTGAYVISRNGKLGLGSAVRNGVEVALKRGADIVVQMDADWQHIPNDVVRLIDPIIKREFDFVIGCRRFYGRLEVNGMNLLRRLVSEVAFLWAKYLLQLHWRDPTSGFRAFRELGAEAVLSTKENGFAFQVEALQNVKKMGLRVLEVPTRFRHRLNGRSKLNLKEAFGYLRMLLKCADSRA
jgi:dolichol-phosphate mannosyltransferase